MRIAIGLLALLSIGAAGLARAGDREDIMAVIGKYIEHEESGNMLAQGDLMTDDRSMVYVGGRLTGDNRKLMREQQDDQDKSAAQFPGVRYEVEIRDVRLQTYNGDSALATMEWFPTRVVPPSLPAETAAKLGPAKTPLIVAVMLVKQAGAWKIAFTTFVPREKG